jgi:hypothetical protein
MDQVLIDTNVLIYSCDRRNFDKQQQAMELMALLQDRGSGCISVQNLAEFFSATTRGRDPLLSVANACARPLARGRPLPQPVFDDLRPPGLADIYLSSPAAASSTRIPGGAARASRITATILRR